MSSYAESHISGQVFVPLISRLALGLKTKSRLIFLPLDTGSARSVLFIVLVCCKMILDILMQRDADFSPCREYRYALWRSWSGLDSVDKRNYVLFIGLNPSTADETEDDPTIRRCLGFTKDWGYQALCMTNLFAFRATRPADMQAAEDPIGPEADAWLKSLAQGAALVVAAWGTHGHFLERDLAVEQMVPQLYCLRQTKDGHPAHPLYLPKDLRPVPYKRST